MKGIYTSPAIQNEIVDLFASEIIKSIIEEVKEAGMYIVYVYSRQSNSFQ